MEDSSVLDDPERYKSIINEKSRKVNYDLKLRTFKYQSNNDI